MSKEKRSSWSRMTIISPATRIALSASAMASSKAILADNACIPLNIRPNLPSALPDASRAHDTPRHSEPLVAPPAFVAHGLGHCLWGLFGDRDAGHRRRGQFRSPGTDQKSRQPKYHPAQHQAAGRTESL